MDFDSKFLEKKPFAGVSVKNVENTGEKRLLVDIFDGYPYRTLFP